MTTTIDLDPFRNAKTLRWHQYTVFAPHRGDDGTLIADDNHTLPLDTYTPDAFRPPREAGQNFLEGVGYTVGIVVVDAETLDDTRDGVRAWCLEHIGRDDISFED